MGRRPVLVPSQVLYDAFDRPGVCRADPNSTLRGVRANDLAQPYMRASLVTEGRQLRVSCRYRPDDSGIDCAPAAFAALRTWPATRALTDTGRLTIDIVADPPRHHHE